MTTARRILPFILLFGTLPACAASEQEDTTSDESAFTAEDASCFDASPRARESGTDARARCLTERASSLIDAQIARAEDERDRSLSAFKGKIRVAGETGCFTEDVSGGYTGLWQNDIDSRRDVGMLAVQLKATVELLKFYYRDLDGYPNHFFESVEICPSGQVGGELRLVGSRLRIGVGTGYGGRIGVHTSTDLRAMWTSGEHLNGNAALESIKGLRWTLLDPVGTPRTTLRRALRGISARLKTRLQALETSARPEDVRSELTRLVRDETAPTSVDDQSRNIRERALAFIGRASAAELKTLARSWRVEIEGRDVQDGAEEGSVMMSDVLNQKDVKVNVSQTGLVNVQNAHEISVSVDAFLPKGASFRRYVETTKTETSVTVNQIGVVNVQTNDFINVRVQVLFNKASQTASLDRVLGP